MLLRSLLGKRDLLIPFFNFDKVELGNVSSELLPDIYRLRYEVYCRECNFIDGQNFKNELEVDEYDDCSMHIGAYNLGNEIIGTVRLVQPKPDQPYPFETHCKVFDEFDYPERSEAAEISRLVVRRSYRRRRGDSMEGVSKDFVEKGEAASIKPVVDPHHRSSSSPLLLLGMYRELYRYSKQNDIRFWYAAMERSLAKSLEKMGFKFIPIGPETDYYGKVMPFIVDLQELNFRLKDENKFLAAWFNDEPIPLWIMFKTVLGCRMGLRHR